MKIVLSGVEGINKGAELMLYAILQEIERKFPEAIVYIPISRMPQGISKIKTKLVLRQSPNALVHFAAKSHFTGLLNRIGLHLKYLNNLTPIHDVDYFIDASGLHFSDQTNIPNHMVSYWNTILSGYHKQGTKIVFLPQAYGPIEKANTKKAVSSLDKYADILFPRDKESEKYLRAVIKDQSKIWLFHDFTVSVNGELPTEFHVKGYATIIPNMQMVNKGIISKNDYINWTLKIIDHLYKKNIQVVLLDHSDDISLINDCVKKTKQPVIVISGLNALEVKGVISNSILCITSRFHGLASALNTSIPCLTTSWNHKYQEILEDYGMSDSLLPVNNIDICLQRIDDYLLPNKNIDIRKHLDEIHSSMLSETKIMWDKIWNLK